MNAFFAQPEPTGRPGPGRDQETARLLAAADPEGLRRLWLDHGGRVRETLRREFQSVLDESEIDDAMSQASQRVWRSGARFDPMRGSLRAWFYCIARNCTLRVIESKRAQSAVTFVENLDDLQVQVAHGGDDGSAGPEPFARDLYRCIDRLPAQQRAVVLADLAAGGTAETGHLIEQLGTTRNSIYVARNNARKALRAMLQAMGYDLNGTGHGAGQ